MPLLLSQVITTSLCGTPLTSITMMALYEPQQWSTTISSQRSRRSPQIQINSVQLVMKPIRPVRKVTISCCLLIVCLVIAPRMPSTLVSQAITSLRGTVLIIPFTPAILFSMLRNNARRLTRMAIDVHIHFGDVCIPLFHLMAPHIRTRIT